MNKKDFLNTVNEILEHSKSIHPNEEYKKLEEYINIEKNKLSDEKLKEFSDIEYVYDWFELKTAEILCAIPFEMLDK